MGEAQGSNGHRQGNMTAVSSRAEGAEGQNREEGKAPPRKGGFGLSPVPPCCRREKQPEQKLGWQRKGFHEGLPKGYCGCWETRRGMRTQSQTGMKWGVLGGGKVTGEFSFFPRYFKREPASEVGQGGQGPPGKA